MLWSWRGKEAIRIATRERRTLRTGNGHRGTVVPFQMAKQGDFEAAIEKAPKPPESKARARSAKVDIPTAPTARADVETTQSRDRTGHDEQSTPATDGRHRALRLHTNDVRRCIEVSRFANHSTNFLPVTNMQHSP